MPRMKLNCNTVESPLVVLNSWKDLFSPFSSVKSTKKTSLLLSCSFMQCFAIFRSKIIVCFVNKCSICFFSLYFSLAVDFLFAEAVTHGAICSANIIDSVIARCKLRQCVTVATHCTEKQKYTVHCFRMCFYRSHIIH